MRRASSLLLLLLATPAFAARTGPADPLREMELEGEALAGRADEAYRNFTERSGLIGVTEARERYKEAVYQYLMGDYAPAATSFYILVMSNALGTAELARDSEYYLAECLFELDDYATSEEAYRAIVSRGEAHPYFPDAVRRSLEIYAIEGDDARFDQYHQAYIASGRVKSTDLITYTLGKAFYRRGDPTRARERFMALGTESPYYSRARYLLGVVAVQAGDYAAAIADFQEAALAEAKDADQRHVRDDASLAVARLLYETGDFARASDWYGKVPTDAEHHADALRESVWTFVYQERWEEATAAVDAFLERYPAHQHTAGLQILRGHLGMKREAYDEALASYEKVVADYTPIAETLEATAADEGALKRFLVEVAGRADKPVFNVPAYAEEMLRNEERVGRAVAAWTELARQQDELDQADALVRQLDLALSQPGEKLQNFLVARQDLERIRSGALVLRNRALEHEGAFLRARLPSSQRGLVAEVLKERGKASAPVTGTPTPEQLERQRRDLVARYGDLHARLKALRSLVADPAAPQVFARYDAVWAGLAEVEGAVDRTSSIVDEAEARDLESVRQRYAAQKAGVTELRAAVTDTAVRSEAVTLAVFEDGVTDLAASFRADVVAADKGIVDVFWLQKVQATDALSGLAVDLAAAQRELDAQYRSLREGLK